jgi:hypothetical protein
VPEEVEALEHHADASPDGVRVEAGFADVDAVEQIRPSSIGSSRLMQRSSVLLPDPEAPIRQMTSLSATSS